jgi:diguanylate cyclase (GGDEF)-like protein/PAS domain S-box-containing protein
MSSAPRSHLENDQAARRLNGSARRQPHLRLLFIHSDDAIVKRCLQEFEAARFNVSADVVAPEKFVRSLNSKYYDLVVIQYPSLKWQGVEALEVLRLRKRKIPLLFLTETISSETVAELVSEGAADCIAADRLGHLPVAARRALSENDLRRQRDQTEKKLRHSEARYRALVGNLTYGMCRCSSKGKFLDVNQALVTMLGYSSRGELMAASHVSEIFCDASKRAQLMGRAVGQNRADDSVRLELDWQRKDGTTLKVRLSGREINDEDEVEGYEVIVEDVTQQRGLEDHLRQEAAKDPLTGLANYRQFIEVTHAEIKRSERTSREFALLFLDLDGLKKINDRFGHLVGSQALCRLADVLCNSSRNVDTAARFGGDEFAMVLPETGLMAAKVVARRVSDNLLNDRREPMLSVSIGIAIYPPNGKTIEALLGAADAALYSMKAQILSEVSI